MIHDDIMIQDEHDRDIFQIGFFLPPSDVLQFEIRTKVFAIGTKVLKFNNSDLVL